MDAWAKNRRKWAEANTTQQPYRRAWALYVLVTIFLLHLSSAILRCSSDWLAESHRVLTERKVNLKRVSICHIMGRLHSASLYHYSPESPHECGSRPELLQSTLLHSWRYVGWFMLSGDMVTTSGLLSLNRARAQLVMSWWVLFSNRRTSTHTDVYNYMHAILPSTFTPVSPNHVSVTPFAILPYC